MDEILGIGMSHVPYIWIVAAGIMGSRPMEITWQVTSWVSTGFRVFGIWR